MISKRLQIILIFISCFVFFIILKSVRKQKINTDLATIWVLWGLGLIIISIFPIIISWISNLLGIESPIHAIYLLMIFLLYILVFVLYLKVAALEEKLKHLVQLIALEEKEKKDEKNS